MLPKRADEGDGFEYEVADAHNRHGRGSHKERLALGVNFPWELLDVFVGCWCLMFVPHRSESEFLLPPGKEARLQAIALLVDASEKGHVDVGSWRAKRCDVMPERDWSPEQREVQAQVAAGLPFGGRQRGSGGQNALRDRRGSAPGRRRLCCKNALRPRVLIACPVGTLVAAYHQRIPPKTSLTVETLHSSLKSTRRADAVYIPPGRLRTFDLILFDEVSQQDAHVWSDIRTALAGALLGLRRRLSTTAADVRGRQDLQAALEGNVARGTLLRLVVLQQHAAARCWE